MDQEVQHLSGGELQRVAITMCLGMPADVYLIDEPSAYLDSEQRIIAAKARLPPCPWAWRVDVAVVSSEGSCVPLLCWVCGMGCWLSLISHVILKRIWTLFYSNHFFSGLVNQRYSSFL